MKKSRLLLLPFILSACTSDFSQLDLGNISSTKNEISEPKEEIEINNKRFAISQLSKLQIGLVATDVKTILGNPDDTSKQTCGKDGFFYKCTIWRYQDKTKAPANLFFNGDFKRLYLIKYDTNKLSELISD
jgi:uncharacterized protein YdaL